MAQAQAQVAQSQEGTKKKVALGITAVFVTYFISNFLLQGINISRPVMVEQLNGWSMFSLLIAIPGLGSAIATLLFGKLSDMYGRRPILLTSLAFFLVGIVIAALAPTILVAIIGGTLVSLGSGALAPLSFAVIGDLFPPEQRARWSGLLNLPAGIAATLAPTVGGMITEINEDGWRLLFWVFAPLVLISGILVAIGIPAKKQEGKQKVDVLGVVVLVIAAALMIFGVPNLGDPATRGLGIILTVASVAAFGAFYFVEKNAEAPVLDLRVLFNRTFITASMAGFFSLFGLLGIMIYGPVFAQEVMGVDPSTSGAIITPFSMLMTFMGIPAGFALAKTQTYKWMYNAGYTLLTVCMFVMWGFNADTPIWLFILVTGLAGFALGTIPTVNTLVAQFAVPVELLGVAVGAIFFFVMMGMAVGPAFLGLAQNAAPDMMGGLKNIFLVGAVLMAVSTLLIYTIPGDAMQKASAAAAGAPPQE